MANLEIEKIIKLIDQKIKALEQTKKVLFEEFGGKGEGTFTLFPSESTSTRIKQKKETRKETIIRLLKDEGSLTSKALKEKTRFPRGTINFVLNDKETFYNAEGKWHLVSQKGEKEKGLTG